MNHIVGSDIATFMDEYNRRNLRPKLIVSSLCFLLQIEDMGLTFVSAIARQVENETDRMYNIRNN